MENSKQGLNPIFSNINRDDPIYDVVVPYFIKKMPDQLRYLKICIQNSAWTEIVERSHQLKGAGGGFGFPDVTALAGNLEVAAKEPNPDAEVIGMLMQEFEVMCERICAALP